MTDRRVKECIIFNPETGISEDGTMSDCLYRPRINQTKKEQKMTREEAIQIVQKLLETNRLDGTGLSQVWDFLKQPVTLAEFLGWEEGKEYEWRGDIFRIQSDILQVWDKDDESWYDSVDELNDYLRLRQAKKVEEPRYLLQTDLTSENGVQYLSFDKKRKKYFIGALMTSENVQQKFTDDEISKIKSITRFAKLCEKVEVEE